MLKLSIILLVFIMCLKVPGDNIYCNIEAITDPNLDQIILENPQGRKNKIFKEVIFTHKDHYVDYEITCLTCHHNWETGERGNPGKCIECHKTYIDDTNRKSVLLRNAFHRCCKDCHMNLRDAKKPTGPVKCRGCHLSGKANKG